MRSMDIGLLPHHIIQRVFDFLGPLDVYRCRCVCKTLYNEAVERLTKCPPIDACQSVARIIEIGHNPLFDNSRIQNGITEEEVITKNRNMNRGAHSVQYHLAPLSWWYFKRKSDFQHLPKPDVDKALENFFNEDMNCVPSFSFVRVAYNFHHLIHQIPFKGPTIGVIQSPNVHFKLEDEVFQTPVHTLLEIPEDIRLSEQVKPYLDSHIEAFHINRFASDHKVIITNWSDPDSIRPDLNDPEYPVKVFISLVPVDDVHEDEEPDADLQRINEFLVGSNATRFICGKIHEGRIFYFNPLESRRFRHSLAISMAFAGKQIRYSWHYFYPSFFESKFIQELIDYKNSLSFPTNDGRVIGFVIFDMSINGSNPWGKYTNRLFEMFKEVKFVTLEIKPEDNDFKMMCLAVHLIRI